MENKKCWGLSPGIILSSSLIAYLVYIAILAGLNFMFLFKLIPIQIMGVTAKVILFILSLALCSYTKKRVRGERFVNCILTEMLFCAFALLTSSMCINENINIAGVVICVLICITGCLILFIKNDKFGKMHKKRYKH